MREPLVSLSSRSAKNVRKEHRRLHFDEICKVIICHFSSVQDEKSANFGQIVGIGPDCLSTNQRHQIKCASFEPLYDPHVVVTDLDYPLFIQGHTARLEDRSDW